MLLRMSPSKPFPRPLASRASIVLVLGALCVLPASTCDAQTTPAPPAAAAPATPAATPAVHTESPQEFLAKLTPAQRQQFDTAVKASKALKFDDALAAYKPLLKQFPGDTVLATYASDAALNGGDTAFALSTLKPLTQTNPDDWLAASLYTRACAESGDAACRDAGIAHMLDLHQRGITPPTMQEYIVEHDKAGENNIVIWASLEPLGRSKSYDFAQVSDSKGNVSLQLTIESSEKDQRTFKQNHIYEFTQGIRGFSLNAYTQTPPNKHGESTQTHDVYKYFIGQPTYSVVREQFLRIASGKGTPISTDVHTVSVAAPAAKP